MKKRKFVLCMLASIVSPTQVFAGGAIAGATEITQISNNLQLAMAYAKQVQQYSNQLLQYKTMLDNLIKNPLSLLGPEIGQMISQVGQIMSAGKAIGSNLSQIAKNYGDTFKRAEAHSIAENYLKWSATSLDTLEGSLKAAGLHRQKYENETAKLQALFSESQNTGGNLQALQTLSKITVEQIQQTQRLGDLIATQNIAASTFMAEQTARQNEIITKYGGHKIKTDPIPPVGEKAVRTWKEVVAK